MNSNYEWQRQQANDRVQARLREADEYRRTKQGNGHSLPGLSLKIMIPGLLGVIVAIWLLTGCTVDAGPKAHAETPAYHISELTMADRIHFHDELEATLARDNVSLAKEKTMAARIHFQDKREGHLIDETAQPAWTMADRIIFQDRVQEQYP